MKKHKNKKYKYKNLLEKLKKQLKKLYFKNKLNKCENNIKNTWKIIKSVIGKFRVQNDSFPKRLTIANEENTEKKSIAEKFNSFFANASTNLVAKIPHGATNFEIYLPNITIIFRENCLKEKELKNAFFC